MLLDIKISPNKVQTSPTTPTQPPIESSSKASIFLLTRPWVSLRRRSLVDARPPPVLDYSYFGLLPPSTAQQLSLHKMHENPKKTFLNSLICVTRPSNVKLGFGHLFFIISCVLILLLIIKHYIFLIYIYKYCKIRLSLKKQNINNHLKPKNEKKNRVYYHLAYNQHKVIFSEFLYLIPSLWSCPFFLIWNQ